MNHKTLVLFPLAQGSKAVQPQATLVPTWRRLWADTGNITGTITGNITGISTRNNFGKT